MAAGLGLAILLFEAGVTLAGVIHPRVDQYYRDYYITRTRPCWLTPAKAAAAQAALAVDTVKVAGLDPVTSCFLLEQGWSFVEPWGVWSLGRHAAIELPYRPGDDRVVLTLQAFSKTAWQGVTVFENHRRVGRFFLAKRAVTRLQLPVPPATGQDLEISFVIRHPARPGGDQRLLGIGLISIAWQSSARTPASAGH
jgi:hypothetical protein